MLGLKSKPVRGAGPRTEPFFGGRHEASASPEGDAVGTADRCLNDTAFEAVEMSAGSSSAERPESLGRRRLAPGDRLGTYEIEGFLSHGPSGDSYQATSRVGEPVVVKYGDPRALAREAEALQACAHPNVVELRDSFEAEAGSVLVLAREEGQRFDQWLVLAEQRQTEASLRPILAGLLEALAAVHGAGYLHRDIAPRNVLVRESGEPLLLDFGAAQPVERPGGDSDPTTDATPGFAPIEQYLASGEEGPWSDLYALAAVMSFALTGSAPPDAHARARGAVLAPVAMGAGEVGSEGFLGALDWALSELPGDRPQSVAEWRTALFDEGAEDPARPVTAASAPAPADPRDLLLPTDEVPETQRVLRVSGDSRGRLRAAADQRPSDLRAPSMPRPRRRRGVMGRALFAGLLLAACAGGAWAGWDYYLTNIKAEWLVDPAGSGDVAAIGDALAKAKPGAVVRIAPGTYAESLLLAREVTLLPQDPDGEAPRVVPASGACITAGAAAGTVRGLVFAGGDGSSPCIAVESGSLVLDGNRFEGWNGTAVRVAAGSTAQISGNRLLDTTASGLVIERDGWADVRDNLISGSGGAGLVVRSGTDPVVTGNRIENSGKAGLLITAGSGGRYSENEIVGSRGSGIEVRDGAAPQVTKSRVEASAQAGLFLYDGAAGEFRENVVTGSGFSGAVLARGAAPLLASNEMRGNREHGVLVLDDAGGSLEGNRITGNQGHGIALGPDSKTDLKKNELQENRAPQVMKARMQRP